MLSDFLVHCLTMIVVIGECVVNRCKGEMRIVLEKLFRALPVQQRGDDYRSDRDTSALDPRAAPADGRISHDVGMCYCRHDESLTNWPSPCNRLLNNHQAGRRDGMVLVRGPRRDAVWAEGQRVVASFDKE
jgi:hypothetical protein